MATARLLQRLCKHCIGVRRATEPVGAQDPDAVIQHEDLGESCVEVGAQAVENGERILEPAALVEHHPDQRLLS